MIDKFNLGHLHKEKTTPSRETSIVTNTIQTS